MARRPPSLFGSLSAAGLVAFTVWLQPLIVFAHGDLHERIEGLSAQLAATPGRADLHLQRADLHRRHGAFAAALADLAEAKRLRADARLVLLAETRVASDAGQTTNTLRAADELLALEPQCSEALMLRARCRLKLNRGTEAVADFDAAIANSARPEPDLYLERARAQSALGQLADAVKGLDEGMIRLGEIAALQLTATEYDRQRGDFASALARVDKIATRQPVKEPWLVLRGEILAQAGRLTEAHDTFQRVLAGIGQYAPERRSLATTAQLEARAREGLADVETRLARSRQPAPVRQTKG